MTSTGSVTINDFGRLLLSGTGTGDDVSVSGTYLRPVALVDAPSANLFGAVGGVTQYQFTSMRFEELYEAELVELFS